MSDFFKIDTRPGKRGVTEIYPKFIVGKPNDLMIRGSDFYAIWMEERGLWSTDEQDVIRTIDRELRTYDVIFNTNKPSGTPKMKVLKPIKDDPDNPFGAALTAAGQSEYIGADGQKHLSPINKLREEGEWDTMAKNLSSQFLSKQPIKLIKQQLNLTLADRKAEYEEILMLS